MKPLAEDTESPSSLASQGEGQGGQGEIPLEILTEKKTGGKSEELDEEMSTECGSVWLLPVLGSGFAYAAMFIPYIIGASNGHIPAVLPFISDGGVFPPESCIFSQFFNMASVFLMATVYVRHRLVVEYYGHRLQHHGRWWRRVSLVLAFFGFFSTFCITLVANFSEQDQPYVHGISASLAFLIGILYIWGQAILALRLSPRMASPIVNWLRVLICIIATVSLILHEVSLQSSIFLPPNTPPDKRTQYAVKFYDKDSPYYKQHIIATSAEWSMVISFFLFVLSFAIELRGTFVRPPRAFFRFSNPTQTNGANWQTEEHYTQRAVYGS